MTKHADPVAIARDLLRCPSVTPAEGGALTFLEAVLKSAGFTVHRMTFSEPGTADVENLYARIGTAAPHLMFAGHTDVVPPGDPEGVVACAVLGRHCRRRAVRPRRGRHEGRDRLQDRGDARPSRRQRRQAQRVDLVPDHRGRGRRRDQRQPEAPEVGGRARRKVRPLRAGRARQRGGARRHHQARAARLAERRPCRRPARWATSPIRIAPTTRCAGWSS